MKAPPRFWIWFPLLVAAILVAIAAFGVVVDRAGNETQRAVWRELLAEAAPALVYAAALLTFACGGVFAWGFRRYPQAAHQLADQTRLLLAANPNLHVSSRGGPEMRDLAEAINELANGYRQLERDLDARRVDARARVEEERNRFAALMSELSEGVLVCNADGRILLYNARVANLLARPESGTAGADFAPLGLGRSVFALLDRDQVAHALDKVHQQLDRAVDRPHTRFVTGAPNGALLRVQVAPFMNADRRVAGMVFTLDDVSSQLGREGQRLHLLQALATDLRAPVANLRVAAESLAHFPEMEPARRAQFAEIAATESHVLTDRLNMALREYADALKGSLTLEDIRVVDLLAAAQRRVVDAIGMPSKIENVDEELWVRVDSFAFLQAIAFLASHLREDYSLRELRFRAGASGRFAELDLVWSGAIVSADALMLWEGEPMRIGSEELPLTLKDVLQRHGSEIWCMADKARQIAWFRLLLPLGEPVVTSTLRPALSESRPEYYDFDLFERLEAGGALGERRLTDLTYTVFDTETTGLEPSAGDEIISIGAVRVVNGRMLKNETFEQLVNPRRSITREATFVHGIDGTALASEPPIAQVLPRFHRFCEDTVLVAHNAAFDMRFLELKEAATGVRFTQPVLDTMLLSAVVHPSFDNHHLDTIAERLGVRVIGRHTALGDALVTGEVFLKILPLLAGRGIVTLGQALEASRESYLARLRY